MVDSNAFGAVFGAMPGPVSPSFVGYEKSASGAAGTYASASRPTPSTFYREIDATRIINPLTGRGVTRAREQVPNTTNEPGGSDVMFPGDDTMAATWEPDRGIPKNLIIGGLILAAGIAAIMVMKR